MTAWLGLLERMVGDAALPGWRSAEQVVFELNAVGIAANWEHQLLRDERVFEKARTAFARILEGRS
jgi:hypothetical protein